MINYTLSLDQLPDPLPIEPLRKPFDVSITPPGSKSITCRAYVLAALADGESKLIRPLRSDDTDHLLNALCTLGAQARWVKSDTHDGEDVYIKGVGGRFPRGGNLYMGDGGAPTRFMIACACLAAEPVTIDASPRMRERPIAEGVEMLRQLGAKIEYVEEEGRLPVRINPTQVKGGPISIGTTDSSQVVSAVLLIAPYLRNGVVMSVDPLTSESYVELTCRVLNEWNVRVGVEVGPERPYQLRVDAHRFRGMMYSIEADASSAVYWMLAAAISPQSKMFVSSPREDSSQPDMGVLKVLSYLGIIVDRCVEGTGISGPRALSWGLDVNAIFMPDASLALAVLASKCDAKSKMTGLRTLRVKETDRIAALANELRKVGCTVETGEDWISITPPRTNLAKGGVVPADRLEPREGNSLDAALRGSAGAVARHPSQVDKPIIIETYNDHRMAMAFAVLGLNPPRGIPLAIRNPACVKKSYPGFWKDFAKLYR